MEDYNYLEILPQQMKILRFVAVPLAFSQNFFDNNLAFGSWKNANLGKMCVKPKKNKHEILLKFFFFREYQFWKK